MAAQMIQVIARDADLAQGLTPTESARARLDCLASTFKVRCGRWEPHARVGASSGGFGLLVLAGYLVRRVGQGGRCGAELLGPGDLLRPWRTLGHQASIPFEPAWNAVSDTEVAVLDDLFAQVAAPYPSIAAALVDRAMLRSRHLAINLAIVQQPRVDLRLHMLLWHLADRWGKAGPEGVTLDAPLTHALLGELVAARRPTVSTAIAGLIQEGAIERLSHGWLLCGRPPFEWTEISNPSADDLEWTAKPGMGG